MFAKPCVIRSEAINRLTDLRRHKPRQRNKLEGSDHRLYHHRPGDNHETRNKRNEVAKWRNETRRTLSALERWYSTAFSERESF